MILEWVKHQKKQINNKQFNKKSQFNKSYFGFNTFIPVGKFERKQA